MGDYHDSATVDLGADALFDFLSDVENMPKYVDRMQQAHPAHGEAVEVEASLPPEATGGEGPQTVRGEAWFRVDEASRTIRWGAEGDHHYEGELEVSGDGTTSVVDVRLHTEHDEPEAIQEGLAQTLANIRRLATTRG
ncbi:MAG: hypothetical protein U0Q15_12060 [Kineosporiaceae bacterium]